MKSLLIVLLGVVFLGFTKGIPETTLAPNLTSTLIPLVQNTTITSPELDLDYSYIVTIKARGLVLCSGIVYQHRVLTVFFCVHGTPTCHLTVIFRDGSSSKVTDVSEYQPNKLYIILELSCRPSVPNAVMAQMNPGTDAEVVLTDCRYLDGAFSIYPLKIQSNGSGTSSLNNLINATMISAETHKCPGNIGRPVVDNQTRVYALLFNWLDC